MEISKILKEYIINQTVEESCDNIIPQNVANILIQLGLVKRQYALKGRAQDQTCLVIYEGSKEYDYHDCIKFRFEN